MGFVLLSIALLFTACGETDLDPSLADLNMFAVDESDSSPDAQIRRNFFNKTGCYLIFSNVLEKQGEKREVKINYTVTKDGSEYYDSKLYQFDLIDSQEKKAQAASFLLDKVMPFMDAKALPYSILPVDTIYTYEYDKKLKTYDMEKPNNKASVVMGLQTTALAFQEDLKEMSAEDASKLRKDILTSFLSTSLSKVPEERFEHFYSFCLHLYDVSFDSEDPNMPDVKNIRELGFLKGYSFRPGRRMSFYPKDKDKERFVKEFLSKHPSVWREENSEYPLVLAKLEELLAIAKELGFSMDYLKSEE